MTPTEIRERARWLQNYHGQFPALQRKAAEAGRLLNAMADLVEAGNAVPSYWRTERFWERLGEALTTIEEL